MEALEKTLCDAGQEPVRLANKVLVLPHGGRVLGLYPREGTNALWVHPAFDTAASAGEILTDPGWGNFGGDRTWISPEVETHIADPERSADTYRVPKSVDPGQFVVTHQDERSVTLASDMSVAFMRSDTTVDLKLTKTVSLVDAPPVELEEGIEWAGYTLQTHLSAADLPTAVRPAVWYVLQVQGGGRIVLPVADQAKPRAFIGDPVYELSGGILSTTVASPASFKFSLRAEDCRGMLMYLCLDIDKPFMVVRTFSVYDSERYSDVPCDNLSDAGHVEQVYVDDGNFGDFGEIEYHSPALGSDGQDVLYDKNRVWAFAGEAAALRDLSEQVIAELVKA